MELSIRIFGIIAIGTLAVGVLMVIIGIILAVCLKRKYRK